VLFAGAAVVNPLGRHARGLLRKRADS